MARKALILLTIACLALIAAMPVFAQTPQKWALVIGVGAYSDREHITGSATAVADADALKTALVEAAGVPADHVTLLATREGPGEEAPDRPTRGTILHEISQLARRVQPGDIVFLLYFGQGRMIDGRSYLLPADASAVDDKTLAETSIEIGKLRDRLQTMPTGMLFMALDSGGTGAPPDKGVQKRDFTADGPRAVATLYACSPGQRSYTWTEKRRGYFAYYLEEGLRGKAADKDGMVSFSGLCDYLRSSVSEAVRAQEKAEQLPQAEIRGAITAGNLPLAGKGAMVVERGNAAPPIPVPAVADTRARLKLTLDPPNAVVSIDGELRRSNPVVLDLGDEKERTVELFVAADGYVTSAQKVTLIRGAMVTLAVTLEKKPATAKKPADTETKNTPPAPDAVDAAAPAAAPVEDPAKPAEAATKPDTAVPPATNRSAVSTGRKQGTTGQNLLQLDKWEQLDTPGARSARSHDASGVFHIRPLQVTGQIWCCQIYQQHLTLTPGAEYRLRFRAKAEGKLSQRPTIKVQQDFPNYQSVGLETTLAFTDAWKPFEFRFRAAKDAPPYDVSVVFLLGVRAVSFSLADISLVEIGK